MAENEALKRKFKKVNSYILANVNPDQAIDALFAEDIISDDDYYQLCHLQDPKCRCRTFLSLLYQSSHPEAFIQLRLALRKEYPQIVDEVDKQLLSPTAQPQQQLLQLQQQQQQQQDQKEQVHAAQSTYGMKLP